MEFWTPWTRPWSLRPWLKAQAGKAVSIKSAFCNIVLAKFPAKKESLYFLPVTTVLAKETLFSSMDPASGPHYIDLEIYVSI